MYRFPMMKFLFKSVFSFVELCSLLAVDLSDVEAFFKITGNINRLWRTQYKVWHMAATWTGRV